MQYVEVKDVGLDEIVAYTAVCESRGPGNFRF